MRTKIAGLVALTLLGAAGCGDDDKATPSAKLAGSITVAAAGGEGEIKALQSVADAFEVANPGTTVTLDTVEGAGDLIGKLTTAFAAQSAPDVFVMNYRRLGGFAAKGVIEPVPSGGTEGMYDAPLEAFTFDGKLLCRPSNASSMVVYYNTKLFTQAGVDVPKSDWTWDDLKATATELRGKGVSSIGFETALIRLAPFVWSNGGEIVDDADKPTTVDLSSPEAKEAVQLLLDLQKTGMSATDRAAQDPEEAFSAGKVAMYLDSRRAVPGFRKTAGLSFDVAPVPTKKEDVSVLHSDGYCVTKAGKNRALAQAFAAFATSGAGANVLAKSGRTVPVKKSVAQSADFLGTEAPKSSQVWLDQIDGVRPLPHTPTWNEAEGVTEEILSQLFAGKTTLDKAIADIAAQTKVELAKA
ncbi:MAG TPA: sugar ABC transporter substrate-binding protein [Mycobacteriales bacterium]|nr:sugar ABC transporter substrate-binding protein [Mycobacteriales bacterium]